MSSTKENMTKPASSTSTWPQMEHTTNNSPLQKAEESDDILSVSTKMNYVHESCTDIFTRRDASGSDSALEGAEWLPTEVDVLNGRLSSPLPSLDPNGFELLESQIEEEINFFNQQDVVQSYYPHCEALLKEKLGVENVQVHAFDHNIRSTGSRRSLDDTTNGEATVQNPAGIVHADYTALSAPRRLAQLAEAPKQNDVRDKPLLEKTVVDQCLAGKRRFAFINVWRNIDRGSPVRQIPLACIDATTVKDGADLRTFKIHYADRVGENYFCCPNTKHKWVYFPAMTHHEAMLLKQWDSQGDHVSPTNTSLFTVHSAFLDPSSPPDAPPRQSIEVRCVVTWEQE